MKTRGQNIIYDKNDKIEVESEFYFHTVDLTLEERSRLEKELNYWRERLVENEDKILFFFTIQFNITRNKSYGYNTLEMAHKATRDWCRRFMHSFTRMPRYFFRYVYPRSKKLHVHGFLIGNGNDIAQRPAEWRSRSAEDCIPLIQDSFEKEKSVAVTFKRATLDIQVYDKNDNAINYVMRKQNKDIDPRMIRHDYATSWFNGQTDLFTYQTDFWPKERKAKEEELEPPIF